MKKTKKQFKEFIKKLPSIILTEDLWTIYTEGYNDKKGDLDTYKKLYFDLKKQFDEYLEYNKKKVKG